VQLYNEGVRDLLHDISFDLDLLCLIGFSDEILLQRFDCIYLLIGLSLGKVYLAKVSSTHDLHQIEVLNVQSLRAR